MQGHWLPYIAPVCKSVHVWCPEMDWGPIQVVLPPHKDKVVNERDTNKWIDTEIVPTARLKSL